MNIYAGKGSLVTVTEESILKGHNTDKTRAEKFLTAGNVYTVEYTVLGTNSCEVKVKEVPDIFFICEQFEDFFQV